MKIYHRLARSRFELSFSVLHSVRGETDKTQCNCPTTKMNLVLIQAFHGGLVFEVTHYNVKQSPEYPLEKCIKARPNRKKNWITSGTSKSKQLRDFMKDILKTRILDDSWKWIANGVYISRTYITATAKETQTRSQSESALSNWVIVLLFSTATNLTLSTVFRLEPDSRKPRYANPEILWKLEEMSGMNNMCTVSMLRKMNVLLTSYWHWFNHISEMRINKDIAIDNLGFKMVHCLAIYSSSRLQHC